MCNKLGGPTFCHNSVRDIFFLLAKSVSHSQRDYEVEVAPGQRTDLTVTINDTKHHADFAIGHPSAVRHTKGKIVPFSAVDDLYKRKQDNYRATMNTLQHDNIRFHFPIFEAYVGFGPQAVAFTKLLTSFCPTTPPSDSCFVTPTSRAYWTARIAVTLARAHANAVNKVIDGLSC